MWRATPLAAAAVLSLCGCSSTREQTYRPFFALISESVKSSFSRTMVTRNQAAAVPYASMGWSIGHNPERMIILATDNNGEQIWTSGDHVVLTLRDGRIVRTVGLPDNLAANAPHGGGDDLGPAAAVEGPFSSLRTADYTQSKLFSVALSCRTATRGRETIVILGAKISTVRVSERCSSAQLAWSFENTYWVSSNSKLVWRSIQYISPKMDPIETRMLRPPD